MTDAERIAVAAIAALMGRDPTTMETFVRDDGIVRVWYTRTSDMERFCYDCRIVSRGSSRPVQVIWKVVPKVSGGEPTRWRDTRRDEFIRVQLKGDRVHAIVRHMGHVVANEEYVL